MIASTQREGGMRMKEGLRPELGVTARRDVFGKLARLSKHLKATILLCLVLSENCMRWRIRFVAIKPPAAREDSA